MRSERSSAGQSSRCEAKIRSTTFWVHSGMQHVQLRRLQLCRPVRPSTAVRLPALRHDAAGIAHQRGERSQIQQLEPVGIRQRRLGRSPGREMAVRSPDPARRGRCGSPRLAAAARALFGAAPSRRDTNISEGVSDSIASRGHISRSPASALTCPSVRSGLATRSIQAPDRPARAPDRWRLRPSATSA
jgi:hypothetical protein